MDEFSPEIQSGRRIVKRPNARNVVGAKRPSAVSQFAGKAVPAALVALGAVAGGRAVVNEIGAAVSSVGEEGVHAALLPQEAHAMDEQSQLTAEKNNETHPLFDTMFHDLDPNQRAHAQGEVEKYKNRVLTKQGYEHEHLAIPIQYEEVISHTADAYGISKDTLMGLIGTENGGGTDITNGRSGARGVAQFMVDTAGQYGLSVSDQADQRTDPVLSIDAAGRYLRDHKALLGGDEGLAVWSYHAGIGNVYKALRIYFMDTNGKDIFLAPNGKDIINYGQAVTNNAVMREKIENDVNQLIKQDKLDVEKLFSNEKVQEFLATLQDYSESYPYTVVAIAKIIKDYQAQNGLQGGGLEGHTADLGNGLKIKVAPIPGIAMRE